MKEIYLDYAATTPPEEQVINKMCEAYRQAYGNPSSIHLIGRRAKGYVEEAREIIAQYIGADPKEIYFTSGGTECDNWVIKGTAHAKQKKGKHIITSCIEHHAILHSCQYLEKQGFEITYLPVDECGSVEISELKKAIREDTILISIMMANNEIGTLQPIKEIGEIARKKGILFHSDAVQALGSVPLNVNELNLDMMSLSAHKIYGPKGVGAMYIKKGVRIDPFMHGGAQEFKKRAGTHNVVDIVGFGQAVKMLSENDAAYVAHYKKIRDYLRDRITQEIEYVKLNGHSEKRLPNNLNVSIGYVEGEALLLSLDMEGICVSTGSACSSGSLKPSHVATAISIGDDFIHGTTRFTVGRFTTLEDIDYTVEKIKEVVARLRAMSPTFKERNK
jgi:cysteine desulfurase